MKANRKFVMKDNAEIGIGTMIVFIASVLVAAVAAAILVNTSGLLQSKGKAAGEQSIKRVASNIEVSRIMADRDDATTDMQRLVLYLSLAPGASKVDLKSLVFMWSDGSNILDIPWDGSLPAGAPGNTNDASAGGYIIGDTEGAAAVLPPTAFCVRDEDGSVTDPTGAGGSALTPGDICLITFLLTVDLGNPPAAGEPGLLAANDQVQLTIVPEVGSPVHADFTMPESFGSDVFVVVSQ